MSDDFFSKDQTSFWGAVAAAFWSLAAFFKYKTAKAKKETNMEQVGIKETKEALDGIFAIGQEVAKVAKDGVQVKDAATVAEDLLAHPEFKAKLIAAIEGINKVPAEVKDIDFGEGVELAKFGYEGVKGIIDELKK